MDNRGFRVLRRVFAIVLVAILCSGAAAERYKVTYVHSDHLGRPIAGTDEHGSILWEVGYSPFGEVVSSRGDVPEYAAFPGQYAGLGSALLYNYRRWYDPMVGRYVSSDPIGLRGGPNPYVYARANPVRIVDLDGLAPSNGLGPFKPDEWRMRDRPVDRLSIGAEDIEGEGNGAISIWGGSGGRIRVCPAPGGARNANAAMALGRKLSALQKAQGRAVRIRTLDDERVRYYGPEIAARTKGNTRGATLVTEYNPKTGQVRQWMESYDHSGGVVRVHPKMIDGQVVRAMHYPPTGAELGE